MTLDLCNNKIYRVFKIISIVLLIPFSGYFVPPTVITGLKDSSRCMQEEIFGPVVCIAKFNGDDEGKKYRLQQQISS